MKRFDLKVAVLLSALLSYSAVAAFFPINKGMVNQATVVTNAGGTTTFNATGNQVYIFEGSSIQTAKFPNATNLPIDWWYKLINNSTQNVAVQDGSGTSIGVVASSNTAYFHLTARASSAGTWKKSIVPGVSGSGKISGTSLLADAFSSTPTGCSSGQFANGIAANGNLTCSIPSGTGGDVVGPALSTDNAIVRFDGTGGKTVQNSSATIDDSGNVTGTSFIGPLTGNVTGNVTGNLTGNVTGNVTGNLTGNVTGNADTATAFAANPTDCSANNYATTIAANGNLTCSQVSLSAGVTSTLPVGNGGTGQTSLTDHGVLVGAGTSGVTSLSASAAGRVLLGQGASSDPAFTATPTLGVAGTTLGTLALAGNTSGTVTIQPQAAAGTYNFNLPTSAGSSGQALLSGGGGSTAMSFGTLSVGGGGTGQTSLTNHGVLVGAATSGITALSEASAGTLLGGVASSDPAFTATPTLGVAGTTKGTLALAGNTSGTITIQPQAAAGTYNFNLPTTAGSSGQPMISGGGSGTAMSWGSLSGNTTTFATTTGTLTSGNCVKIDANGNLVDNGAACAGSSAPTSRFRYDSVAGYCSSSCDKIRYYTTQTTNAGGSDLTQTSNDSTNGLKVTINTTGTYCIEVNDQFSAASHVGISLNSSQLTTGIGAGSFTGTTQLCSQRSVGANQDVSCTWCGRLNATDIVRPHTDGISTGTDAAHGHFDIIRIN